MHACKMAYFVYTSIDEDGVRVMKRMILDQERDESDMLVAIGKDWRLV